MSDTANQVEETPDEQGSGITVSDTVNQDLPAEHPGVEEGEVLTTTVVSEESGEEVTEVQERIVFDYDDEGNQIGWHKEVVA